MFDEIFQQGVEEEEEEEEERKTYSLVRCEELAEVQCPNTAVTQLGE